MAFNFNISLSVLNHLGRNLYRSFITVIGEAISNSWDADANNVYITIDRDSNTMSIVDDGIGMDDNDFQNKFLKIGYTKRKDGQVISDKRRPFIGRKGIGKLALLSCAKEIEIASLKQGHKIIGGSINNSELDTAIKDDINSQDYKLGEITDDVIKLLQQLEHGTAILFKDISEGINNTIDYIRKLIALNFKFSLLDKSFKIYINDEVINERELDDLAKSSQFVWIINDYSEPYLESDEFKTNLLERAKINSSLPIKGFIATVEKPSQLKIRSTDDKITLDLFVNGRLREKDLMKYKPTARVVESYSYGQIFYANLDTGTGKDLFTSSREGMVTNDETFKHFLDELGVIYSKVLSDWDAFRLRHKQDGDPDNTTITPKQRKAQELFFRTMEDMGLRKKIKKNTIVNQWVEVLSDEVKFNIPSYTECFIAENLLRAFIKHNKIDTSEFNSKVANYKERETKNKNRANISYDIRENDDSLFYLDMEDLSIKSDPDTGNGPSIEKSAKVYRPIRNAIGHTSIITEQAKNALNVEFNNIKARLDKIVDSVKKDDSNDS